MKYIENKIEAYYSKIEILIITILFIVSFGFVMCVGILADRSSLGSLLMIALAVSISICGGIANFG